MITDNRSLLPIVAMAKILPLTVAAALHKLKETQPIGPKNIGMIIITKEGHTLRDHKGQGMIMGVIITIVETLIAMRKKEITGKIKDRPLRKSILGIDPQEAKED